MSKRLKNIVVQHPAESIFVVIEAVLYITFLVLDIKELSSTLIKYMSICLCMAMSIYLLVSKNRYIIAFIMLLTLIADTFLLVFNNYYIIGVMAFCIVQTIYAAILILRSDYKTVIPRVTMYVIAVLVLFKMGILDILTALAGWSFVQLTINVIHAFFIQNKRMKGKLFAVGLLLFWKCDVCVGMHNMIGYISHFPFPNLLLPASFGMWMFYLPAQIFIVLSFFFDELVPEERRTVHGG